MNNLNENFVVLSDDNLISVEGGSFLAVCAVISTVAAVVGVGLQITYYVGKSNGVKDRN